MNFFTNVFTVFRATQQAFEILVRDSKIKPIKSHYALIVSKKPLVACSVSPQALHREVSGDISEAF